MANSNGYKAQYKISANGAWQTRATGTEQTCMSALSALASKYPYSRVIDSDGRVVS